MKLELYSGLWNTVRIKSRCVEIHTSSIIRRLVLTNPVIDEFIIAHHYHVNSTQGMKNTNKKKSKMIKRQKAGWIVREADGMQKGVTCINCQQDDPAETICIARRLALSAQYWVQSGHVSFGCMTYLSWDKNTMISRDPRAMPPYQASEAFIGPASGEMSRGRKI